MENTSAWTLPNLPLEVWRDITCKLTAIDIFTLLCIGNHSLVQKLTSENAIMHLNYIGPQDRDHEPYLLEKLNRLESLALVKTFDSTAAHVVGAALKRGLLSGLRSFTLHAENALSIWQAGEAGGTTEGLTDLATTFPVLSHLHLQCSLQESEKGRIFTRYIAPSFPTSLKSLYLPGNSLSQIIQRGLPALTSLRVPEAKILKEDIVRLLPKTLTMFEAECPCNDHTFSDYSAVLLLASCCHPGDGPKLSVEEIRAIADHDQMEPSVLHIAEQLDQLYPSTQHESIKDRLSKFFITERFKGFGAVRLLPKLKHFHTVCSASPSECWRLPSTLEGLKLGGVSARAHDLGSLLYPRNLTSIDDSSTFYPRVKQYFADLPPNLTKLRPRIFFPLPAALQEGEWLEMVSLLPKTLTFLQVSSINATPAKLFPVLPPLLKAFNCCMQLSVSDITLLPQSLTQLSLGTMKSVEGYDGYDRDDPDPALEPRWPPALTKLKVEHGPFSDRTLSQLPSSIRTFRFQSIKITDFLFAELAKKDPDTLRLMTEISESSLSSVMKRHFRLFGSRVVCHFTFYLSHRCLSHLSPFSGTHLSIFLPIQGIWNGSFQNFRNLTKLRLLKHDGYAPSTHRPLSDGILLHLSPTLQELVLEDIPGSFFTERALYLVPKNIKRLEIDVVHIRPSCFSHEWPLAFSVINEQNMKSHVDNIITNARPRFRIGKTELTLSFDLPDDDAPPLTISEHITEIDLPHDLRSPQFYTSLPPGLRILHLESSPAILDDLVPHMPRGLTSLRLDKDDSLTNACVPHLPPQLLTLALLANTKINDFALPMLPKTLTSLEIPSAHEITDFGMDELPPRLEVLNIAMARISHRCFHQLPRSLTVLDLSGNDRGLLSSTNGLPTSLTVLNAPASLLSSISAEDLPWLQSFSSQEFMTGMSKMAEGMSLFDDC